ncbi:hypothetical protein [Virgibacillus alimentarius]|uniref:Uncharacterized protein n=1 Tax=Virgibacillus alimentarius TaxID=698769 RepID=A0ABS4S9Z7_9BACI|nr:hypothetical protein [Virgibacillus alimentarius]MBP2258152.1 hypothetical protein [Virgibacillus alimentarius]
MNEKTNKQPDAKKEWIEFMDKFNEHALGHNNEHDNSVMNLNVDKSEEPITQLK